MKLKDWLKVNKTYFRSQDLSFILKIMFSRKQPLILEEDRFLDRGHIQRLEEIRKLYTQGMPLAYILGREDFFGREFKVDNRVLIPRKETELIVEKAIAIINDNDLRSILDLCCGCANIAISVKKEVVRKIAVFSTDISLSALEVAQINSREHKVSINLINADLLSAFGDGKFDLIVSNPPYVEVKNIKGSLNAEPRQALEAGDDGLHFIEKILKYAFRCLQDNGYLIIEIGYQHKKCLEELIYNLNFYIIIEWVKDYSGHWRGVVLQKKI